MNFNARQKKVINGKEPKILCLASAASGKCLPNSTIIPTPEGPKRVDEVKIGDYLFDRLGRPTKVLGVYPQGEREVYQLTFGDGRTAKCSKDHIWAVNKRTWKDKTDFREWTVERILNDGNLIDNKRSAKFYIQCSLPVQYSEKEYSIPPYVIGAMLGDGCCQSNDRLTLSSENEIIPKHIVELMNFKSLYKNPANFNWTFYSQDGHLVKTEILPKEVRALSYNKRIPYEYKYGSIEQRLELIRGLMDTDGSISKDKRADHKNTATVRFTSTSKDLICDVKEVLGSLGYVSTINEDNRSDKYTNNICYDLIINIPNSEKYKLFWLPRKKEIALSVKDCQQKRNFNRTSIREIKNLGYKEEMTCFYVDNEEHLFLTENFVVTHNTRVLTERIRHLVEDEGISPRDIVAITFTQLAAQEMRERLGSDGNEMFIGTIHSYANRVCSLNSIRTDVDIANGWYDHILKKATDIPQENFPHPKHVLVDECQDLCPLEYNFIIKIPAENFFFCGDNRQQIYQFKGSNDQYLIQMYKDLDYKKYFLTENYRNTPEIINFADNIINSSIQLSPKSIPIKKKGSEVIETSFADALEELEISGNWGAWFILARTNTEIATIQEILAEKEIPYISFKKGELDTLEEIKNIIVENKVKVLTIHTSKGLESPNVIVVGAKMYSEEERKIAYVAATRAENKLYWCPTIAKRKQKKEVKNTAKMITF